LNASTKILCRFPDEATRDRVANEVVQKYQSFNVTVVETLEEDCGNSIVAPSIPQVATKQSNAAKPFAYI